MSKENREHFVNGIKVSDEVARIILSKETYFPNDSKSLELYNNFIAQQKEAFKAIMYYFNDILTELKLKGKVSHFTEFRTRIKAPESALRNDEINNVKLRNKDENQKGKVVDDIFAMSFVCANDEEVNFVIKQIEQRTRTERFNNHKKDNGYVAKHRVYSLNESTRKEISEKFGIDEDCIPIFEVQFKTIAVDKIAYDGEAAHTDYKKEDPKDIQIKYDRGQFLLGYNIPQMWVSKEDKMVQLSSDETLRKLYPFLDMSKGKEKD